VDALFAGVGTGGTVTGTTQFIKGCAKVGEPGVNPALLTVAIEPMEQMLLTEAKGGEKIGPQGPHRIQGIGAGIVPKVLDLDLVDEVFPVHSDAAQETTNELWMAGIPTGVSAGANVNAAVEVMSRPELGGKTGVVIIPSFGERCVERRRGSCVPPRPDASLTPSVSFARRYFTHPMWAETTAKAHALQKQPLPEPFDNTEFGFATPRG
jgi:cysteine synthase A